MNASSLHQTVIVPVGLGEASRFNRAIFPLSSYRKRDQLGRGDLYLDATLDEILRIVKISANPRQHQELVDTTKAKYDRLILTKTELENSPKSSNLLKRWARYRAARMLLAASKALYYETKGRSEEIARTVGRSLLSIPREDIQPVEDDVPPDANLAGIAVQLDTPLDDPTRQQILNAANMIASYSGPYGDDQAVSDTSSFLTGDYVSASESLTSLVSTDTEDIPDETPTLPPSSPMVVNYYSFCGSIYSPGSNIYGATVQSGGSSSGSTIHTITHQNTI